MILSSFFYPSSIHLPLLPGGFPRPDGRHSPSTWALIFPGASSQWDVLRNPHQGGVPGGHPYQMPEPLYLAQCWGAATLPSPRWPSLSPHQAMSKNSVHRRSWNGDNGHSLTLTENKPDLLLLSSGTGCTDREGVHYPTFWCMLHRNPIGHTIKCFILAHKPHVDWVANSYAPYRTLLRVLIWTTVAQQGWQLHLLLSLRVDYLRESSLRDPWIPLPGRLSVYCPCRTTPSGPFT